MNDLVSEYQQYQDATAEGKCCEKFEVVFDVCIVEEGEGGEVEEEEQQA